MDRVRQQIECDTINLKEKGKGITIAVLDTGVALHPDLSDRILLYQDFISGKNYIYDDNGHGTHVCGIACGSGRLSNGKYMGIAPKAGLIVGKVLNSKGEGNIETMLAGLEWVQKTHKKWNVKVLNISVGLGEKIDNQKEMLFKNRLEELGREGMLGVCAAGNNGPYNGSISHLGDSSSLITVGCHDGEYMKNKKNRCETYSARGKIEGIYRKPDIVAPGTDIVSCNAFFKRKGRQILNAYSAKSGTSMATPMVSASLALLMADYPALSKEQVKYRLLNSAVSLQEPPNKQGYGMLNVKRLLTDFVLLYTIIRDLLI